MLEAALHEDNAFLTLTYDEDHLPLDGSVHPKTFSAFVKRLRKGGAKFRYFAVGEYGDNTFRPHYHAILFGFPTCRWGITRKSRDDCCPICVSVRKAWGKGTIELGTVTAQSCAYVAGYLNKKMVRDTDPRLGGRRPEFARMSLRPGIGYQMMHEVASTLMEHGLDERLVDVPILLQHGRTKYPLGRYLRRKLRTFIGRSPDAPPEALAEYQKEMQPLREAAFLSSTPFKTAILAHSLGKRIQIEAAFNRNRKRNT